MDLTLSGDEEQIVSMAASFLRKELPLTRLRARDGGRASSGLRARLAELGWFGIGLPESLGGAGLGPVEEMLVFREIGRALGPTTVLPMTLAARTAAQSGLANLARELLTGRRAASLAVAESPIALDGEYVSGAVRLFDTDDTDTCVLCNEEGAVVLDLTGQTLIPIDCLDKSVSLAKALLQQAPVLARLKGPMVHSLGMLMTAAMLVGIAEATLAMITEYAKVRVTFGRPIGSYQAVRHPCADMAVRCEAARSQLFLAAVALRDSQEDLDQQLCAAKVLANDAAVANVDANIQLHGGIGITAEHDAHLYMKRAHVLARWFGSDRTLLDRILAASRAA